ncbi:MAG: preprotein translocase subunit SecE [Lachnospiraceae bacterium]
MGENSNEKVQKRSFFKGLKSEFKKVIWPDKTTLAKQSVAVVIAMLILGIIIAVLDVLIQYGVNFLISL